MKRIEKLTKEQEALMPVCRDYWIKKGLQTGDTDCLIVPQKVYNPYSQSLERSRD